MTHGALPPNPGIDHVELGITDLRRSLDFYRGVLGFAPAEPPGPSRPGVHWLSAGSSSVPGASVLLALVETDPQRAGPGGWRPDDLQRGFRHLGFKVGDVPAYAERLRSAGVRFTLEPLEAVGDVRLAFFTDPDGALLEIIDGHLGYHRTWSRELAEREAAAARARPASAGPVFDHVAVTVANLQSALELYRDELGHALIGGLDHSSDARGFTIDYLQAGACILELFTFTAAETEPSPWTADPDLLGIRGIGAAVPPRHHAILDPQDLLHAAGGRAALEHAVMLRDNDGIVVQLRRADV